MVRIARVERRAQTESLVPSSLLTIEVGSVRVGVPAGFDAATVRSVLDALVSATGRGAK